MTCISPSGLSATFIYRAAAVGLFVKKRETFLRPAPVRPTHHWSVRLSRPPLPVPHSPIPAWESTARGQCSGVKLVPSNCGWGQAPLLPNTNLPNFGLTMPLPLPTISITVLTSPCICLPRKPWQGLAMPASAKNLSSNLWLQLTTKLDVAKLRLVILLSSKILVSFQLRLETLSSSPL